MGEGKPDSSAAKFASILKAFFSLVVRLFWSESVGEFVAFVL